MDSIVSMEVSTSPLEPVDAASSCPQCSSAASRRATGHHRSRDREHRRTSDRSSAGRSSSSGGRRRERRRRHEQQQSQSSSSRSRRSSHQRPPCCSSSSSSQSRRSRQSSRTARRSSDRASQTGARTAASSSSSSSSSSSNNSGTRGTPARARGESSAAMGPEEEASKCQIRSWPHSFSFLFASLSCTLSLFGLSRFAILTVDYGPIFIVQFLVLSLFLGIPAMTLFVSLGQYLGSGVIDMWRVSPLFQGVGIALMLTHSVYGLYNIAAVSWLFIYLRDSFITNFDRYKWTLCYPGAKYKRSCEELFYNGSSFSLESTLPDYFSGAVLLRSSPSFPETYTGELRFQTLFNIIVIWMALFIGLSKGLKSYGKVSFLFGILPVGGFLVFSTKVMGLWPAGQFRHWFFAADWPQFLANTGSWVCAARETFFTWIFLGSVLLQLASHNHFKHKIVRDSTVLVVVTLALLVLSGLTGVALHQTLTSSGYQYTVSSFETIETYQFLDRPIINGHAKGDSSLNTYDRFHTSHKNVLSDSKRDGKVHVNLLAGIRILEPWRDPDQYSGYQVMRLATELVPAYASILGPRLLSPFWVVLFFFSMILFGLGQQLALCHTVVSGLIAIRPDHFLDFESALTFITCLLGLVFCFPLATELGLYLVYFLDYTIGCAWWVLLLYLCLCFALFVARGKPYAAENIVTVLLPNKVFGSSILRPLLAFQWTFLVPVGMLALGIISFKTGRFQEIFDWSISEKSHGHNMPAWAREVGAMLQLLPLIMVPFVAIVQICRYFLYGPDDFYERLKMLYRPPFPAQIERTLRSYARSQRDVVLTNFSSSGGTSSTSSGNSRSRPAVHDPPPKYTPPPSYSTATGARLARFLRQSFRQSVRRLREITAATPAQGVLSQQQHPPTLGAALDKEVAGATALPPPPPNPPDYATVIIETAARRSIVPVEQLHQREPSSSSNESDFIRELIASSSNHPSSGSGSNVQSNQDNTVNSFNCGTLNSAFSVDSELPNLGDPNLSLHSNATSTTTLTTLRHQPSFSFRSPPRDDFQLRQPSSLQTQLDPSASLGRTVLQSQSFRYCSRPFPASRRSPYEAPSLERVDSQAILVRSAEPIDTISPTHEARPAPTRNDESQTVYMEPIVQAEDDVGVANGDENEDAASSSSTLSLGEEPCYVDSSGNSSSSDSVSRFSSPDNMLEARNIEIIVPAHLEGASGQPGAVTLEMDMTTSVI